MTKDSRRDVFEIAGDIRWNFPGFPSTFGPCPVCGTSARGAGLCVGCLTKELGALVGDEIAQRFTEHTQEAARALSEAQDAQEDNSHE